MKQVQWEGMGSRSIKPRIQLCPCTSAGVMTQHTLQTGGSERSSLRNCKAPTLVSGNIQYEVDFSNLFHKVKGQTESGHRVWI